MKGTKKRILDSSLNIIRKQDDSFSMRRVAEETNISLGNLQYHFKTKDDLLIAVINYHIELYNEMMQQFLEDKEIEGKDVLLKGIQLVLETETTFLNFNIDQIFTKLSDTGNLRELVKDKFYNNLFELICSLLKKVSPSATDESLNRAASILLPFFDSYLSMNRYIKLTPDEIRDTLVEIIWELLNK